MEINYFKSNLKYLRSRKCMTQSELGSVFDLKKSQISSYEVGSSFPLIPLAIKIAQYFEITLSDLFESDLQNPPDPPPPKGDKRIGQIGIEYDNREPVRQSDLELSEAEVAMDAGGVSMATESPPQRTGDTEKDFTEAERKKLKKLLEMIS
jgi:DNA-binding XRE family transcriptional regulator